MLSSRRVGSPVVMLAIGALLATLLLGCMIPRLNYQDKIPVDPYFSVDSGTPRSETRRAQSETADPEPMTRSPETSASQIPGVKYLPPD